MRKSRIVFVSVLLVLLLSGSTFSQEPTPSVNVAPNAPKDKPIDVTEEQARKLEQAIKPYIEMAKRTYPEARERFLKGLPPRHTFFITTRLRDSSGAVEQVFIAVREIKDGTVSGLIWSEIKLVTGYKIQDPYTFPETELIDWLISKPDGTEEGNFVGNFLDTYKPDSEIESSTWRESPATPARMKQRIDEAATKSQAKGLIPRIVLYDIGYPRNGQESADLDSQAVLLLTVLTHDKAELPLQRVYVMLDGKQIELRQFKLVLSQQEPTNNSGAKTFGPYRMDALYLLPMYLRTKQSDLVVDFAKTRVGMKVGAFGTPLPPGVPSLPMKIPTGLDIQNALDRFVKREFPSFF